MRLVIPLLFLSFSLCAQSYTDFYVQTTGNNLNSGSTTNDAPHYFGTGGWWTNATAVWRKDGQTFTNVVVGDYASVYPDATTVNPVFIGLVTNVTSTNIWMSLTAAGGTSPANDVGAAGATSIRIGGAWRGPNTNQNPSSTFPFSTLVTYALSSNIFNKFPCINFKSGVYSTTNTMTQGGSGPIRFQGYLNTVRDGLGKATFDGGLVYPGFIILTVSTVSHDFEDIIFSNNGASGAIDGVVCSGNNVRFTKCVFTGMRRRGVLGNASAGVAFQCEAYNCNKNGSANVGAFDSMSVYGCVSHDNTNAGIGFTIATTVIPVVHNIAYNNSRSGFQVASGTTGVALISGCDAYSNVLAGVELTGQGPVSIYNCNFLKNGSGITNANSVFVKVGNIVNCGFGSGTQANTHGNTTNFYGVFISGSVTYASGTTPWTDPANGNFTIPIGSAARAAGSGVFTQNTVNSPTNTIGYPDIGAAQSASTNAFTRVFSFSQ